MKGEKPKISIVIPCYNEQDVIKETIIQLNHFCNKLSCYDVELVFVDDGSADSTRDILKKEAANNRHIKIIGLSRNFGHQIAVTAGIDESTGDAVVLLDADLQDPPEVIDAMIEKWQEGYDVVYGTRKKRIGESKFKRTTAHFFYRILNRLSNTYIPFDTGDFRLMSRNVVEALKSMPEHDRFIRGMVSWVGFKQISIQYDRAKRFAGVSKYPLYKMIQFALDGIFSFSVQPLRLAIGIGTLCSGLSFVGVIYALIVRLYTRAWVPGWAGLMIAISFIGGIQLLCMGIMGEYIGRIYGETKKRPLYIVQEKLEFNE